MTDSRALTFRHGPGLDALLLGAVALVLAFILLGASRGGLLGFDFRGTLWDSGKAVLSGRSPYAPAHEAALRTGNRSVYLPPAIVLVSPLTVLPWAVGLTVWLVLSGAAVLVGFRLLGVRDPRLFAVAFLSNALLAGLALGNLELLLFLGAAAAWRWRDRPAIAGAAVAAVVVGKLFLWPLIVWLLVTRRLHAAAWAIGLGALSVLVAWAVIGFDGFRRYPHLLRALSNVYSSHSDSLASLGISLGLSSGAADACAGVVALALLATGAAFARRGGGDLPMLSAALLAGIAATPVVWMYYLVLLFVPLALSPRGLARTTVLAAGSWIVFAIGELTAEKTPCCRPPGTPKAIWTVLNTKPSLAVLVAAALLLGLTAAMTLRLRAGEPAAP